MKNSADLGGCYPPRPSASVDNTLLDLQNSSYPTQPHSIIAKYFYAGSEEVLIGQYIKLVIHCRIVDFISIFFTVFSSLLYIHWKSVFYGVLDSFTDYPYGYLYYSY